MKTETHIGVVLCVCVVGCVWPMARARFCDGDTKEHVALPDGVSLQQTTVLTDSFKRKCMFPLVGPHDLVTGNCSIESGFSLSSLTMCDNPNLAGYVTQKYAWQIMPPGGNTSITSTIYCLTVLNRGGEENWGTVFVDGGGVGFDFINVRVESQKHKGLRYETTTYTRNEPKF